MSVNLSVRQLETDDFIDVVRNALADTDLSASATCPTAKLQEMCQAIDRRRKGGERRAT
jgi:EAL domain-containing protein (putative c-di-GMP-specific phosphodiesterase class I)